MWVTQRFVSNIGRAKSVAIASVLLLTGLAVPARVHAITPIPTPPPAPGSYGLLATKTQPAPTTKATITTPGNGSSFSTSPITVSGLCTKGLLVQVYDNGALVGAIDCTTGSFSIQVSLFTGKNDLTAIQFDNLGQPSPTSGTVTVNFDNSHFSAFGALITLTSNYGRRAADPGTTLTWPLQLSGGTGPYAFSIDWGDGKPAQLKSQALAGEVDIDHVYDQSGVYHVTVKVTDKNGVSAFLQLVAVANGKPTGSGAGAGAGSNGSTPTSTPKVMWLPTAVSFVLLLPTYWLGRRSELLSLHKHLEKDMENYHEL